MTDFTYLYETNEQKQIKNHFRRLNPCSFLI